MNIDQPLQLLNGLTPRVFMQRYWQRKPLLIRQAIPGFKPPLSIGDVRKLVSREEVESRLIWKDQADWQMKHGPFSRLPAARRPDWTVLAQSVDIHDDRLAELLHRFRFISDARLDDAMISIASDGGGVGPHFDSYDVFLLQAHGQRRWRISQQTDLGLEPGLPLKILKNFQHDQEFVLEPGDMLYLPPHVAHDGVAIGDCMTISIGFRAPTLAVLARGMLEAAGDQLMARNGLDGGLYGSSPLPGPTLAETYKDKGQAATPTPALVPDALLNAALDAVGKIKFDQALAARFMGLWLTEPSQAAMFESPEHARDLAGNFPAQGWLRLDRCSRMMYRKKELYINGELAAVPASASLRKLADERQLACSRTLATRLTADEIDMLEQWLDDGWLHYQAT